jgi:hypothetical protein
VLTAYDLPDLIGAIAPRKIVLADIRNSMLEPASKEVIDEELKFPRAAYSDKKVPDNIKVVEKNNAATSFTQWAFE